MKRFTNIIGILIGIVGIFIGIYFHYSSKEKKEISYYLDAETYKIYDNNVANGLQKISLYREDSIKISQNVFLATFSVWNSGNMPIETQDIRQELSFKFKGINEILELKTIKEKTPDVSKFQITQIDSSSLKIHWRYFDPDDGIKFQLLFLGDEPLDVEVNGKILKTELKEFELLRDKPDTKYMLFIGSIILIFLIFFSIGIFKGKYIFPFDRLIKSSIMNDKTVKILLQGFRIFMIVMLILYLVAIPLYYYRYFFGESNMPF
jgi:hypothetical protein